MVAWAAVLVCLVVVTGRTEASEKAVISLDPPWTTIFRGDRSTLTCQAPEGQVSYYLWYKDGKYISRPFEKEILVKDTSDSGEYTCSSSNSETSDAVRIIVSEDWAILQTPYYAVFEGDELPLNCLGWRANTVTQVWYYKNTQQIASYKSQKSLSIKNVGRQNSGTYHCIVELYSPLIPNKYSQNVQIDVKELFTSPSLTVRPSNEPEEGSRMKLVCYTEVSQEKRSSTVLRYALYINERNVFKDQSSPEFDIPALQLSDSGNYKCAVQTISNQVQKESSLLWISVKRKHVDGIFLEVQPQNREVIEGEKLTMTCCVAEGTGKITFSWCRQETKTCTSQDMVNTKSAEHTITAMTEEDSGQYYCTASNDPSREPIKSSAVKIDVKRTSGKTSPRFTRPPLKRKEPAPLPPLILSPPLPPPTTAQPSTVSIQAPSVPAEAPSMPAPTVTSATLTAATTSVTIPAHSAPAATTIIPTTAPQDATVILTLVPVSEGEPSNIWRHAETPTRLTHRPTPEADDMDEEDVVVSRNHYSPPHEYIEDQRLGPTGEASFEEVMGDILQCLTQLTLMGKQPLPHKSEVLHAQRRQTTATEDLASAVKALGDVEGAVGGMPEELSQLHAQKARGDGKRQVDSRLLQMVLTANVAAITDVKEAIVNLTDQIRLSEDKIATALSKLTNTMRQMTISCGQSNVQVESSTASPVGSSGTLSTQTSPPQTPPTQR